MKPVQYNHDRPYIPATKNELLNIIAKNQASINLQKPEYQGRAWTQLYWLAFDEFKKMNKDRLYAIYFDNLESKPKKIRVSRLEKKAQNLQPTLFDN